MTTLCKPNYERIFEVHAIGLQNAYSDYKRAMKDYLDNSWFGADGEFKFSVKCAAALTDAEDAFNNSLRQMIVFKELLEDGNRENLDRYIKGEGLC